MSSAEIYVKHGQELFYYILKNVRDTHLANDILQNTFYKIQKNIHQLRDADKSRAWVYAIARNEIVNSYKPANEELGYQLSEVEEEVSFDEICCFDRFIEELPATYKEVIELVFIKGIKQEDAANQLGITLPNAKARIRRSKAILKGRFVECCDYQIGSNGKLVGEANCSTCG